MISEKISKQVKSRIDLIENPRLGRKKPSCVDIDIREIKSELKTYWIKGVENVLDGCLSNIDLKSYQWFQKLKWNGSIS